MNANELADIQAFKTEELTMWERNHTAAMLRAQQAEIEALKAKCLDEITKRVYAERATEVVQELYTHPAELTDEVYFCSRCGKRLGDGIHTCTPPADILRKAQEK